MGVGGRPSQARAGPPPRARRYQALSDRDRRANLKRRNARIENSAGSNAENGETNDRALGACPRQPRARSTPRPRANQTTSTKSRFSQPLAPVRRAFFGLRQLRPQRASTSRSSQASFVAIACDFSVYQKTTIEIALCRINKTRGFCRPIFCVE
jgi:hypothetical protein